LAKQDLKANKAKLARMVILGYLVPLVAPELPAPKVFKENRAPLDTPAALAPLDLLDQLDRSDRSDLKVNLVLLDTPAVLAQLAPSVRSAILATKAKLGKLDALDQLDRLDRSVLLDMSPTPLLGAIIKSSLYDALAANME
jgi:hypothetical protein